MKKVLVLLSLMLTLVGCSTTREIHGSFFEVVSMKNPTYPSYAAKNGIEGFARLVFDILPNGSPSNIEVIQSEPEGIFDKAAIDALSKWKFKPKFENGKPVTQFGQLTQLDFKLPRANGS